MNSSGITGRKLKQTNVIFSLSQMEWESRAIRIEELVSLFLLGLGLKWSMST